MTVLLWILAYFVGMIITLTIFRCNGWVNGPHDKDDDLPPIVLIAICWPIAIGGVVVFKLFEKFCHGIVWSVECLVQKFCPRKYRGE